MNYTFWPGILIVFVKMFYFIFSQREKMAGLTIYVPIVRKTLETLIFKVKGMLVANNSPDAFWMGNLKNKTIRGDEIMSQVCILCKMSPFIPLLPYCYVIPRTCKNYVQDYCTSEFTNTEIDLLLQYSVTLYFPHSDLFILMRYFEEIISRSDSFVLSGLRME
jgi:hypothetical protein